MSTDVTQAIKQRLREIDDELEDVRASAGRA